MSLPTTGLSGGRQHPMERLLAFSVTAEKSLEIPKSLAVSGEICSIKRILAGHPSVFRKKIRQNRLQPTSAFLYFQAVVATDA